MATEPTDSRQSTDDLGALKRKLAWRMGFAALMIIGLLGGLALFDRLSIRSPEPEAPAPQFTEPVPVGKKSVTQPVTPAEGPSPPTAGAAPSAPEASAAPIDKSVTPLEPPPRPEVAAQPSLPRATSAGAPAQRQAPVGRASEARAAPAPAARAEAASAQPATAAAAQAPAPVIRLLSGYTLQAGVFADPRRAEELHARIVLEGIPATIETRVHAGPFQSRGEAEAARAQLKAMGIDAVLLAPKGGKK